MIRYTMTKSREGLKIMKKWIALLLAVLCLFALAACAETGGETTPPTENPNKNYIGIVAEPLTWEKINAIPIANDGMTEDELRQICVDFMRLQITFPWTPNKNLMYMSNNDPKTINKGYAYGGMPYKGSTVSNLYNVMPYYDEETGIIDVATYGNDVAMHIGNQCSGSAYWAWSRVSNSITWGGTQTMLESNGCLRVGAYTYPDEITSWHNYENPSQGIRTADICADNGRQVMFESYALLKPADGISVYKGAAGHVRMVSNAAVVVRSDDGSIDPDQSYITYLDQTSGWSNGKQPDGSKIKIQGSVDTKFTFEQMYKEGYLPWRIPELAGKDDVEKAEASLSVTGDSITVAQLRSALLKSNYTISDVTCTVKDKSGAVLYTTTMPTMDLNVWEWPLSGHESLSELETYAKSEKNIIEISTRVGTGEKLVAYSGTLAKG